MYLMIVKERRQRSTSVRAKAYKHCLSGITNTRLYHCFVCLPNAKEPNCLKRNVL